MSAALVALVVVPRRRLRSLPAQRIASAIGPDGHTWSSDPLRSNNGAVIRSTGIAAASAPAVSSSAVAYDRARCMTWG